MVEIILIIGIIITIEIIPIIHMHIIFISLLISITIKSYIPPNISI